MPYTIHACVRTTIDVQLVISVKGIFLINNKTGAPIRPKIAIDAITFVALSSTNSKQFSFVSNNEELNLKTLHSFKATRGAADEVPVAINEAFMVFSGRAPMPDVNVKKAPIDLKKAAKQKSKLKKKPPVKRDPGLVGAFEAKYLCSLAVDSKNGSETVAEAWASASSIGIPQGTGCIMLVTMSGIQTLDAMTQAPLFNTVIKEVSFTTACGPKNKIFAYISNNEDTGRIVCHMYNRGDIAASNELLVAIGLAFKKAAAEAANPFIVKGKDKTNREKPPDHLMKRQIRRGHMEPVKLIGQGQFGQVWLGTVQKPTEPLIKCAVKLLKGNARDEDKEDFSRECEMMLELDHPNLTIFLGCAVQQKPWLCVLEFLAYGDVKGVLEGCAEKKVEVSSSVVLHYTKQTAEGMAFMANLNLVHMDLAARNVLLHLDNLVKIADFGLTHRLNDQGKFELPPGQKLPMKWMAPEAMDIRVFSTFSDVWAFAITTWEMFAMGAMPYPDHKTSEIQDAVRDGLRNEEPDLMPEGMHKLMLKCWEKRPSDRPNFTDILVELSKFSMGDVKGDLGKDLKAAKDKKAVAVKAPNAPPWYFGNIPKEVCDKSCLDHPPGSFLVRALPRDMNKPPPGDPPSWCLTCNDSGTLKNFLIKGGEGDNVGKFIFAGNAYNDLGSVVKVLKEKAFKGKNGDMTLGEPARKPRIEPRRGSVVRRPSGATESAGIAPKKGSVKSGGIAARKGSGKQAVKKPFDPKAAIKKASNGFDPMADKRWKKFPAPMADAEYSLKEGTPGDFMVLQDTDLDVYFIVAHATKTDCVTWTVKKEGGKCVFGRAPPQDTIEGIIVSLMGVKLPAKGLKIELLRPGALKRSPGTAGAAPAKGATKKAAPADKKKKKKTKTKDAKADKPKLDEEGFGFDAGAAGGDGAAATEEFGKKRGLLACAFTCCSSGIGWPTFSWIPFLYRLIPRAAVNLRGPAIPDDSSTIRLQTTCVDLFSTLPPVSIPSAANGLELVHVSGLRWYCCSDVNTSKLLTSVSFSVCPFLFSPSPSPSP